MSPHAMDAPVNSLDVDALRSWMGRTVVTTDVLTTGAVERFNATTRGSVTSSGAGSVNPLLVWALAPEAVAHHELGEDGHPLRGEFLPPVPLPRRMWAASSLSFYRALAVGEPARTASTVRDVTLKHGSTGPLVFVTVERATTSAGELAVHEEQTIVYRDTPAAARPAGAVATGGTPLADTSDVLDTVVPDPVLLMRYSALTFNSHRIHYDRPYAMQTEGYPGLVVHGPLIATLLLDRYMAHHPGTDISTFSFRARKPLFDTAPFTIRGRTDIRGNLSLSAVDACGEVCMTAEVTPR
ncbi:hypothetical protein FE374_03290 [Georgenia yuyongxinii]|uniref:FAS1-like dehydratase domain-containing protein n=1 Tax=Georgenia yuyongxinii TaxID=2589797 RepID=A0A5B8C3Q7_9MICO|nr:MaoC family dehydratase N-terminal domain-containing protein [Georgenia yuyongxinii]QDC23782.1 hypothetical protein FE374_03290 [Georgenia yuyongxinii]